MYSSDRFVEPYLDSFARMHRDSFGRGVSALPKMEDMEMLEEMLVQLFFPGHQGVSSPKSLRSTIEYSMESTTRLLYDAITRALRYEHPERSEDLDMSEIEAEVRNSAQKIIAAKKATYYGIGMALVRITKAIFSDENSILTISSLVDGPYGIKGAYLGLPCIVGREGRVKLLELDLTEEEQKKLEKSAAVIKEAFSSVRF